MKTFQSAGEST